jgi:hypothetical protein
LYIAYSYENEFYFKAAFEYGADASEIPFSITIPLPKPRDSSGILFSFYGAKDVTGLIRERYGDGQNSFSFDESYLIESNAYSKENYVLGI